MNKKYDSVMRVTGRERQMEREGQIKGASEEVGKKKTIRISNYKMFWLFTMERKIYEKNKSAKT